MGGGAGAERLARVRLNFFACNRCDWLLRLLSLYGGAAELLRRPARELALAGGVTLDTAERLKFQTAAADPEQELRLAEKAGASVLTALDAEYPSSLRKIFDPPIVLYVKGELRPMPAAGIVGTRRATPYGLRTAARLAQELCAAGVAVASGLARGVDTAAHQAALKARGVTWAAMGTGLGEIFPRENEGLAERILEGGGALISEFPMGMTSYPSNFPRRNRIISGLSLATVVVEGGFESGALITARFALEQGREVLGVPGPADSPQSRGPNYLLKNGAYPAENADDIIARFPAESLFGIKARRRGAGPASPQEALLGGLSTDALLAFREIASDEAGLSADEVVLRLGWPVQRASAALFELESAGTLMSRGGRYCRGI